MKITHTTQKIVEKAIEQVSKKYDYNIGLRWGYDTKPTNKKGTSFNIRLVAKSYGNPGYRRTFSGKRNQSACWHVCGDFFDAILDLDPGAIIYSGHLKIYEDRHGHGRLNNWQDWNIGSLMQPLYFSEACDCGAGFFSGAPKGSYITSECPLPVQSYDAEVR